MRVLVVEDEKDMNKIIVKMLKSHAYSCDSCFDGEEALLYVNSVQYDIILLDVMMPKMDGFSFVEKIRADGIDTPVLFLTAKDLVEDKVKGLDLGANDYLVKPFSFDEFFARIRALTRKNMGKTSNILSLADLTLDISTHTVIRSGNAIALSAKEYAILEYMLYNQGIVLSREQMESHIWDYAYEGSSNMIDVYIRYLRKKIDEGHENKLIHTVRGVGYVLKES